VSAILPTEGTAPDYCVLFGGEPLDKRDAGGTDGEGYVEAETDAGRLVTVSYDLSDGLRQVTSRESYEAEEITEFEPADGQPDSGTLWVDPDGDLPAIEIAPWTEVDA